MTTNNPDELIENIGSDVMTVLTGRRFFEKLDDKLCPADGSEPAEKCTRTYVISEALLQSLGFDKQDLSDIFAVLQSRGGFCDCEILYNASEANRLKAKYWKRRADDPNSPVDHHSTS